MPDFDAYHELLGIAPSEQPPTHYRLLGVTPFESSPTVIERAADRQLAHLRSFQVGKHSAASQRLLTEVSKARQVLLNDTERANYDVLLRQKLQSAAKPAQPNSKPVPVATPLPAAPVSISVSSPGRTTSPPRKTPAFAIVAVGSAVAVLVIAGIAWLVMQSPGKSGATAVATKETPSSAPMPVVAPPATPGPPAPPPAALPSSNNSDATPPVKGVVTVDEAKPSPATGIETSEPAPMPAAEPATVEPTEAVATPPESPAPSEVAAVPKEPMDDAQTALRAEVETAKSGLKELPKFKKFYDYLAANPDKISVNGPKLAGMIWTEARENAVLREHLPSYLAALQEVELLATAGSDYQQAIAAIDAQRAVPTPLLNEADAQTARCKVLASAAEAANTVKAKLPEREALLQKLRAQLPLVTHERDTATLEMLLAADKSLTWTNVERVAASQQLIPQAQQALANEATPVARVLLAHLDLVVESLAPGKERKEATETVAALHQEFDLISEAQIAKLTLTSNPQDAAANQTFGLYLLLQKGQWRESLPHFAQGTEATWHSLAADTLKATTTAEKAAVADRWAKEKPEPGAPSTEIARALYREILADSSVVGIPRAATESKLNALGPSQLKTPRQPAEVATTSAPANAPQRPFAPPEIAASAAVPPASAAGAGPQRIKALTPNRWTAIFPHLDFNEDTERGHWLKPADAALRVEPQTRSRLRLPVVLTNCSYDMVVEFDLGKDHDHVYLIFPVADRQVLLVVDGYETATTTYFDGINGVRAKQHPAAIKSPVLRGNEHFRYKINVRLKEDQAELTFSLNGKKLFDHEGPIAQLAFQEKEYGIQTTAQPALVVNDTAVTFTSCDVRLVEGDGFIGRAAPLLDKIPADVLARPATSLTKLEPLTTKALQNQFGVSKGTRNPIIDGAECTDYLYAHAPSRLTYAMPAGAKYFTATASCPRNASVTFVVKVDGKELFSSKNRELTPVCVELPAGGKVLELECEAEGKTTGAHSTWCFPAFR